MFSTYAEPLLGKVLAELACDPERLQELSLPGRPLLTLKLDLVGDLYCLLSLLVRAFRGKPSAAALFILTMETVFIRRVPALPGFCGDFALSWQPCLSLGLSATGGGGGDDSPSAKY